MNSVKIVYIICSTLTDMVFLAIAIAIAIATPIWITPGYYWWSATMFILIILNGLGFSKRLNSWKNFGHV